MKLGKGVALPDDYATRRVAIVAQSGGGKTYTAAVIAEELVALEQPFYALDPTGAWWGLRSSATGKRDGLPVIVIGGEHGDVPLDEHSGAQIAELVVHEPSFYVLDLSGLETRAAEVRFATAFLERLYRQKNKNRAPLHGFWDEADLFAPQRAMPNETKMLGSAESIIRRGRIRGLGTTLITQRPAVLNKNVLTQIDLLIALKLIAPQDRKAVKEYLDGVADPRLRDEVLGSLASLQQGEAWLYGPGLSPTVYGRTQVRERKTFNSSATASGADLQVKLANVDLDALRTRLAAAIDKAKADDPAHLRQRIADLEREARAQTTPEPERVEVPVLPDDARQALERTAAAAADATQSARAAVDEVRTALAEVEQLLGRLKAPAPLARVQAPAAAPRPRTVSAPRQAAHEGTTPVKAGARRMLEAVASLHPMPLTRSQLGTLAKVKSSGGTYSSYLSALKTNGLLDEDERGLTCTQAGFDFLGTAPPAPATADELRDMWRDRLKAGARTMLDLLIDEHPEGLTRQDLAERAGIASSGGTFSSYLSMLRTAGLMDERNGMAYANDVLFIGAA